MTWQGTPEQSQLRAPAGLRNGARILVRRPHQFPLCGTVTKVLEDSQEVEMRAVIGRKLHVFPMSWCEVRSEKRRDEKACPQEGYRSVGEQFR